MYHSAAKLIVAHARGDKDEVVRLHFARAEQGGMGTVTKRMNSEVGQLQLLLAAVAIVLGNSIPSLRACPRQVGYLFSSFYHDRDSDDVTGGTAPSHIVHIGKPRAGPPCSPVQPPPGQANEHSPGSARAAAQRLPIAKESFRRCWPIEPRPEHIICWRRCVQAAIFTSLSNGYKSKTRWHATLPLLYTVRSGSWFAAAAIDCLSSIRRC